MNTETIEVIAVTEFRLPGDTHRLAIIGRTGSGKTQAAVWQLSLRRFDKMPWIIFNFKDDDLISSIPGTQKLDVNSRVPTNPGLYVIDVVPDEKEDCDDFLMRVWAKQNVGLYIDEGYMLSGLDGFRRCLTQGRSRRIPMIVLSQRPRFMDRFTWSEADYFQLFNVSIQDDVKTVQSYIGEERLQRMPPYHSLYYDVSQHVSFILKPVPDRVSLLRTFKDRLGVKRRVIA